MRTLRQGSSYSSSPSRLARRAITLLLVDDTDAIREVLQMVLTFEGYTVETAPDGPAALEIASRTRFDMLVTDFEMPGMDGYTLAVKLIERRLTLPVLVISGADPTSLPLCEIERRNWNFLPKPLSNAHMLQIIDSNCLGYALLNAAAPGRFPAQAGKVEAESQLSLAGICALPS